MEKVLYFPNILAVVLSSLCLLISGLRADEGNIKSRLNISLTTDKEVYSPDDVIEMTLKVSNQSDEEITLQFKDTQRFDFIIESNGERLWRWSDGRIFAQVIGEERLMPRQSVIYKQKFEGKLEPGTYKLTATVVNREIPLVTTLVIFVCAM
ncbi:MAG: hypothetical protein FP829_07325 [Nitrospirae bacterium]|nr:hypothetical protein [Nitrospirota bacterium]